MVRDFGAQYIAYQRRVPWMIPWVHLPTPRCAPADSTPDREALTRYFCALRISIRATNASSIAC